MNAVEAADIHNQLIEEMFDLWWSSDGRMIDPDTGDVPWYDKREGLAAAAFIAGYRQAMKLTAIADRLMKVRT